jgi:hypothetical protein
MPLERGVCFFQGVRMHEAHNSGHCNETGNQCSKNLPGIGDRDSQHGYLTPVPPLPSPLLPGVRRWRKAGRRTSVGTGGKRCQATGVTVGGSASIGEQQVVFVPALDEEGELSCAPYSTARYDLAVSRFEVACSLEK